MPLRIGRSKHAAVAVAALLAWGAAPASGQAPDTWTQKAGEIAAPWPGLQQANGSFRDYVLVRDPNDDRDDYGDAILGYGLLLTAARTGDAALADSGLRALELALSHPARSPSTQVFHELATVSAYNLARERFASHPVFQRARSKWEDVLRGVAVVRLGRQKVTNKSIVEAIVLLELLRSGLASDPAGMRAAVKRLLATDLPRASRPFQVAERTVLGDLPLLPPAYHALSVGMLARTIALLGDEAPSAARTLLRRAVAESASSVAPDGDVAYHGRSQAQAWTLPLVAYGAGRGRLAELVMRRLVEAYPVGPEGLLVTPSLAAGVERALPGVDEYVAAASYVGLTLVALEWAIAGGPGTAAPRTAAAVHGTGEGAWATSTRGEVWFAVKRTRSSTRDLRYDFGLVAMKVAGRDVLPPRPRTLRAPDSAGPLLRRGGAVGYPEGTELRLGRKGAVVVRGGFRTSRGRWLRRGVTFTFTPVACGVRLTFAGRPGDVYDYSGFFRADPDRNGRGVEDDEQRVEFGTSLDRVTYRGGYASGTDARLARATLRTRARRVSLEVCAL
jgi:hypothetical protein